MSTPTSNIQLDPDDVAQVLTALADTLNGYPERELADGWRQAAARVAQTMRGKGHDDEGTWNEFTGEGDEGDEEDEA